MSEENERPVHIHINLTARVRNSQDIDRLVGRLQNLGEIVKISESTEAPNCQEIQNDRNSASTARARRGNISMATIERILSALVEHFKHNSFTGKDAQLFTESRLNVSYDTTKLAMTYAVRTGLLFRVRRGCYNFQVPARYAPMKDSLVDVVCSNIDRLELVFRLMGRVSDVVNLYFGNLGVFARFSNSDRTAVMDIHIDRAAFDVYSVKDHVRLTLSCRSVAAILERQRASGPFHLLLKGVNERPVVGALENEHELDPIACEESETPYPAEVPTKPLDAHASFEISTYQLEAILSNIEAHSDYVRVTCREKVVTFEPAIAVPAYRSEIKDGEQGIRVNCKRDFTAGYSISAISELLVNRKKHLVSKFVFRLSDEAMTIELIDDDPKFAVRYYIAPVQVEEQPLMKQQAA